MKQPTAINILGDWIEIKFVEEIPTENPEEIVFGDFCETEDRIRLRQGKRNFRFLIHEIMHALISKSGHDVELREKEEAICKLVERFEDIFVLSPTSKKIRWKETRQRNPETYAIRKRAHEAVRKAVKAGKLTRPEQCQSCNTPCKPHGHHTDYHNPLAVMWLCEACHRSQHSKEGKTPPQK